MTAAARKEEQPITTSTSAGCEGTAQKRGSPRLYIKELISSAVASMKVSTFSRTAAVTPITLKRDFGLREWKPATMEITPEQYERTQDCWPAQRGNVRPKILVLLNAILYVAEHECKWRGLPKRFGNWHSIYVR